MKVGILSDIHGNSRALDSVCIELKSEGINKIIVAGDLVGYYYNIKNVISRLAEFDSYVIKGNHEELLFEAKRTGTLSEEFRSKYGSSLSLALQDLNIEELNFLVNLKHPKSITLDSLQILISHGSPWDINEYLYSDSDMASWNKFLQYEEDFFVIGHTHQQLIKRVNSKIIINPGSIGQNRIKGGIADWAVLETNTKSITFRSTRYPIEELIAQCELHDPEVSNLRTFLTR